MTTHHATLSADLRKIANGCDLGGLNTDFFLRSTFISDLASYVQKREEEAFQRGVRASTNGA